MTSSGATKKGPLDLTATVDFAGYGSPVTITVPPPSQVKAIPLSTVKMFEGMARPPTPRAMERFTGSEPVSPCMGGRVA